MEDLRTIDIHDPKKLQPYRERFKILDVKVTPSAKSKFGPGTGTITAMCPLAPLRILYLEPRDKITGKSFVAASRKAIPGKSHCPYGFFNPDVRGDGFEFKQEDEGNKNECAFMIVGHLGHSGMQGWGGKPIGLVFKKCGTNKFTRIGLMRDCLYDLQEWEAVSVDCNGTVKLIVVMCCLFFC